jgi:hypothetical protein
VISCIKGTGESGKSTILKQFRLMHANGFSEAEVNNFRHQIKVNILHAMIALCRGANLAEFATQELKVLHIPIFYKVIPYSFGFILKYVGASRILCFKKRI